MILRDLTTSSAEPSVVRTLSQWRPSLRHETVDYQALWREAITPSHPILVEQVNRRLADDRPRPRYGHRDTGLEARLPALIAELAPEAAATLLVEAFERLPILERLADLTEREWVLRHQSDILGAPPATDIPPVAGEIRADLSQITAAVLRQAAGLGIAALSDAHAERVAWASGHGAEELQSRPSTVAWHFTELGPLLLGAAGTPLTPARDQTLAHLLSRLDEAPRATHDRPAQEGLLESLCARLGRSPEDSPYLSAREVLRCTASRRRAEIEEAAGADMLPLIRRLYAGHGPRDADFLVGWPEVAAFEALTPERRGAALVGCLWALSVIVNRKEQARRDMPSQHRPYFGSMRPLDLITEDDAGTDREPRHLDDALSAVFNHFIGRKLAFPEAGLTEMVQLMACSEVRYAARTLHVIKHIERRLAVGADPVFVEAVEALNATFRADPQDRRGFNAMAVTRLTQALEAAAKRGGEDSTASDQQDAAESLAPPPLKPIVPDYAREVLAFYDEVADWRKFTPEHVAFIDRLIAEDAAPARQSGPSLHPVDSLEWLTDVAMAIGASHRVPGENAGWLGALRAHIVLFGALSPDHQSALARLGEHTHHLAGKSSPSRKWLAQARLALHSLPEPNRIALLDALLDGYDPSSGNSRHSDLLRGLIYLSAEWTPTQVGPLLVGYALSKCYRTVPGFGMQSERHGNACLWALDAMPGGAGVPYLARLSQRVKYPKVRKAIDVALDAAARAAGLGRSALDELSVPTHDLVDGAREVAVGGGAALVQIVGTAAVAIRWRTPEGRETASVPAALKSDKDGIKAARTLGQEIEADLSAQVARLQRLFREDRSWGWTEWRERYADHPLLAGLVRRLIWTVTDGDARESGILVDGALHDREGRPIAAAPAARVNLWHPVACPVAETLAWRARLGSLGLVQPFKQAHREVYVVTDAERATGTYSNRFAGHILKQHQMMALARAKGWTVTHRIWADVENDAPTHLVLAEHGLVAEFWTEGAGGDDPEVTDAQAYLYLTTDQVRFYRIADPELPARKAGAYGPPRGAAVAMAEVPPLVFSEVMRDCDLFTGVASVASDPAWIDAGAAAAHPNQWRRTEGEAYWRAQSVGDLGEAARTRAEILAAIVPALAASDRIGLEGRFLTVQGRLRRYRIHIGSGNILMEPDDRYLCIVKADREAVAPPLPFEGDAMLSLILSKALLLVEDDRITDPGIVRQIAA